MLCNKKHKAQESCSSEKYEKNPFKTMYLFQHILERQKRPCSLCVHIVCSPSKGNVYARSQRTLWGTGGAHQPAKQHSQRALFITRHLHFPLSGKIKKAHSYFNIFSWSKGQSAGFTGAAGATPPVPCIFCSWALLPCAPRAQHWAAPVVCGAPYQPEEGTSGRQHCPFS